jgi:hypothetical protein
MRRKHLGDSYDLVKRFWSEGLREIAPLYAHPRFVPSDIRDEYTQATSIAILNIDTPPQGNFGILLDPDTGIPLPGGPCSDASGSHASLEFIIGVNEQLRPAYMICFDQSYHQSHDLTGLGKGRRSWPFCKTKGSVRFITSPTLHFFLCRRMQTSLPLSGDG